MGLFDDLIPSSELPMGPNGVPRITITKSPYADAVSSVESGGDYRAVGPVVNGNDRALGKYQILASNIRPWSKEVLGREVTPTEFINSPELQDQIFGAKFGSYVDKYGPEGAARAWFAGEGGMNNPNARDSLGTSVSDYASRFMKALGPSQANAEVRGGLFADLIPRQAEPAQFSERFADFQVPTGGTQEMKPALEQRANDLTAGPQNAPSQQMDLQNSNIVAAASQGTSPNVSDYNGRLVSNEAFQDETGAILYRDPQTGEVKPTDSKTQVAIRDPRDGVVKVFQRSGATDEGAATGVARVLAPGLTAGAPTARPAIAVASKVRDVTPKASDIMATAKPFYKAFEAEASKIEVPGATASGIVDRIKAAIEKKVPEYLAPEVYRSVGKFGAGAPGELTGLARLEAEMNRLPVETRGVTTSLDKLRDIKELVGQSFKSPDSRVRQAAAIATAEINKIISEVSTTAGSNLRNADQTFATAKSMQELQRKEAIAGLRAGRAGYGGNAVNSMRQVLSPIVEKAINGRTTGFRPDEIKAMRDIVEGTTATNVLRGVGQLSPSKGIMQTGAGAVSVVGGAIALGPTGAGAAALIPALGAASNKIAAVLTAKQIERLSQLVAKRSPAYAQGVSKAIERYARAQAEFASNPTPGKLGAYVSASRALSSGLTHDGIAVSSGDLLRSIQGPAKSAAGDQEQPVPGRPGE